MSKEPNVGRGFTKAYIHCDIPEFHFYPIGVLSKMYVLAKTMVMCDISENENMRGCHIDTIRDAFRFVGILPTVSHSHTAECRIVTDTLHLLNGRYFDQHIYVDGDVLSMFISYAEHNPLHLLELGVFIATATDEMIAEARKHITGLEHTIKYHVISTYVATNRVTLEQHLRKD